MAIIARGRYDGEIPYQLLSGSKIIPNLEHTDWIDCPQPGGTLCKQAKS